MFKTALYTRQPTNKSAEGGGLRKSASRRPSLSLAILALTTSLGSVTHKTISLIALMLVILVAVEDPNVGKLRTIVQDAIGRMRGHSFGWKALWDSKPEWSCSKLD